MKSIKIIAILFAVCFLLLGMFFVIAAFADKTKMTSRLITGVILLMVSGVLILLSRMRVEQVTHTIEQKIDLSGDIDLDQLKCKGCGGTLSKENVEVKAGAVMASCPYCGTVYQIKEAPKW